MSNHEMPASKEEEPKTIYTARPASDNLASQEMQNPWYVQRGHGTSREWSDGKVVLSDLELVNGREEAKKKAEELADEGDLILGLD